MFADEDFAIDNILIIAVIITVIMIVITTVITQVIMITTSARLVRDILSLSASASDKDPGDGSESKT